jgi:hypothetical protein
VDEEIMTLLDRAAVTFSRDDQGGQGQGDALDANIATRAAMAKHPPPIQSLS